MIFSNSCKYAIKSCIYLALKKDKADVSEIAEYINSPVHFTSKILQKLSKNNIISSAKGRNGGFYLNELQYNTLTVKDICKVIENEDSFFDCVLGQSKCDQKNLCPMHHLILKIKENLQHVLSLKINQLKDFGNIKY